jgi:hypothetical protein
MFPGRNNKTAPLRAGAWHRAQPGQIVGPRHARPEAGLRVAAVPPHAADLTGPVRDADGMAGRGGGTGALIEPRNIDQPVDELAE